MNAATEHGPSEGQANPAGKVGYGSPPENRRYKKGTSGNPNGRPRRTPREAEDSPSEVYDIMAAELGRMLRVTENGRVRMMPALQVIQRNLVNQAVKGDREASRILLHHQRMLEQDRRRDRQRRFDRQVDYKRRAAATIHRCDLEGYEPPKFVPHPDDMRIDSKKQQVIINGPADDVEKAEWDASEVKRQELTKSIAHLKEVLTGPDEGLKPFEGSRTLVLELLDETKEELAALDATYPSEKERRRPGYIRTPCPNQKTKDRERPVTRRTPEGATPACEAGGAKPESIQSRVATPQGATPASKDDAAKPESIQSRLERLGDAFSDIDRVLNSGQSSQPILSDRSSNIPKAQGKTSKAERHRIVADRQKLTGRICYLDRQLSGPEEALDAQFETNLDVAFAHKIATEKLHDLDERYPDAEQWQQSGSKRKQRRKQGGTSMDPPRLH